MDEQPRSRVLGSTSAVTFLVAVDLGGTRVRAAQVLADGSLLRRLEEPTDHRRPTPDQVCRLVRQVAEGEAITQIIIGIAGRINAVQGKVTIARNLPPSWLPLLTQQWFVLQLGAPVALAGDAELAAVGEAYFGAGTSVGDMAYLTFSTGVGAAALIRGRLITPRQTGFQIGLVHPGLGAGPPLDDLASGKPIQAFFQGQGKVGRAHELLELAANGNLEAAATWRSITEHAAWTAVAICHIVCPDVLVVGGGLSRTGSALLDPVKHAVKRSGPEGPDTDVEVRLSKHADDAALVGAAAWITATSARGEQ
jgi:glucokinase